MSFVLIGVYRPPSAKSFHDVLKKYSSGKEVLILGDLNLNYEDKLGKKALNRITNKFDLTQLVKGPTRITSISRTQIDLIFSNKPERVPKTFNMITGL